MNEHFQPPLRRRQRLVRMRKANFRRILLADGWYMKGAYAEKIVAGQSVVVSTVKEAGEYLVCCVQLKSDFWADKRPWFNLLAGPN